MPSEVLIFDVDLTPLNWLLNGTTHFGAINSEAVDRNIWCAGPDIEDWISMTDPSGDVGGLIRMDMTVKFRLVFAPPSGNCGVAFHVLKTDDTQLGSYGLQLVTNPSPHEYSFTITLAGSGADSTNMKMRIRSYDVGGWPVGQGIVQIYRVIPTLVYDPATVSIRTDEVHAPIPNVRVTDAKVPEEEEVTAPVSDVRVVSAWVPNLRTIRAPIDPTRVT